MTRRPSQALRPFKRTLAGTRRALLTTSTRSTLMAGVRQKGTAPELAVRRAATAAGLRYTLGNRDLGGSPDLANRTRRVAVFVHGCFWHRHAGCARTTTPRRNRRFWLDKFEANVRRDRRAAAQLRRLGFAVITIWECQVDDQAALARKFSSLGTRARMPAGWRRRQG